MKALPPSQAVSTGVRGLCYSEMSYYRLHGTDEMIFVAIEGIVAHGPGGNSGKFLVLRPDL
jgi:hypothetical protein